MSPKKDEKQIASEMKERGYSYAILFDRNVYDPLYTKTLDQATETLRDDFSDIKNFRIVPIESVISGKEKSLPSAVKGPESNPGLKPPANWTHKGTVAFFERHDGSVHEMISTLETIPGVHDPAAFAASIKDYVLGTTGWRGSREKKNPESNPCPDIEPHIVKNPKKWRRKDIRAAEAIYETFCGYVPEKIETTTLVGRTVLIKLGRAVSITYEAKKHGRDLAKYIHDFEDPDVSAWWDMANACIVFLGGDIEITEAGIEG